MHKQEITIYDVAREAQVSMATVSRVVNGNSNVRKETREKVLAVIKRLHYQPNAVAQGLASKRSTTVGLIVPDLTNLYFSELSKGIDDIALLYKYNIILSSVQNRLLKEDEVIQNLLNKQVDGVIYMSNRLSNEAFEAFERTNTPVVLTGTVDSRMKFPTVTIDYKKADHEAFDLLYNNGKEKLALIVGEGDASINRDHRIPAYKNFMKSVHLPETHIYRNIFTYEDGYNLYPQLVQEGINGILVTRDMPAAGILNAALDSNVKVPDEFEIITSSATKIVSVVRPTMTSIKQPLYDIGAVAMRMLTKMMSDEKLEQEHVILPYQIVKRGTTK